MDASSQPSTGSHHPARTKLCAINHLPVEVLVFIFSEVTELTQLLWFQYYSRLFKLYRTCRYWRVVISNTPLLWTILSFNYVPKLQDLILERSSGVGLHVHVNQRKKTYRFRPQHVKTFQIWRWKTAQLSMKVDNLDMLLDSEAPLLQDLLIKPAKLSYEEGWTPQL